MGVFEMTAANIYGTAPVTVGAVAPPVAVTAAGPSSTGWRAAVDPQNPIVWMVAIVLVTVGAAGVAGSARVGPAKVSGALGKGA
jgi:hypothetical protein